jgi:hypothetical protein
MMAPRTPHQGISRASPEKLMRNLLGLTLLSKSLSPHVVAFGSGLHTGRSPGKTTVSGIGQLD